ncbi:unnamed protein product [Heterosigma akashiwo]
MGGGMQGQGYNSGNQSASFQQNQQQYDQNSPAMGSMQHPSGQQFHENQQVIFLLHHF